MEVTGHTIPLQRERLREMRPRFEDALDGTYDPAANGYVPSEERTKTDTRRHLFDFMDAMRLHVSLHRTEEAGVVIHGYAQWFDDKSQPNRREEGVKVLVKRMQKLMEALDAVDEPPEPIDAGISESGVPHAFFPYPSPAFESNPALV